MIMNNNEWEQRYQQGKTGWDRALLARKSAIRSLSIIDSRLW